jgi:hypothetical protein
MQQYMLISIKDVVDEPVDDGGFADCLVTQKYNFVFEEGWDCAFG